jgi:hypothetical protein
VFYDGIKDVKINTLVTAVGHFAYDEFHIIHATTAAGADLTILQTVGARDALLRYLTNLVHGDELVAELILYTLVSHQSTRTMLAGKMTLNVTSVPDDV